MHYEASLFQTIFDVFKNLIADLALFEKMLKAQGVPLNQRPGCG